MGICLSCLGGSRRQHSSHEDGDLDRILNSRQPSYGAIDDDHAQLQPDEEDMRREREALEHITASAANQMIDVMHPSRSDLDHSLALANAHQLWANHVQSEADTSAAEDEDAEAEEAAWLKSIRSAGLDTIRVPKSGNLTINVNLLRAG